ncbi:sensor histidine kinase [Roseisolibacter sp. H3M3-2]|uniref:sensor histidine kinase n=1 Tax=Roseisolibacter sp. H3M3-2 TaxID=3031323 RepID=UPI0023DB18F7|nr:sensor histidine kinase [Roseisolibacter sp. H3M3-2]MDF1504870.1 sensor histidine kinase [Roseisolibacter sp. H3M3-2]
MRLAAFVLAHREPILAEWEAFARSCAPASGPMDVTALRDHADEMLRVIAADLASPQTGSAQSRKSQGRAPAEHPDARTAAGEHGAGRAQSGFTLEQMVAEYRALRASVIRLWTRSEGTLGAAHVEDLTRFNEAIDQALAESVTRFNRDVEQAKETFLAILGHDLRTPLGAIQASAAFMLETGELEEPHRSLVARVRTSARRATTMVGDLLDFTRSRLGGGIPIVRAETSLGRVVRDVVNEVGAAHPGRAIRVDTRGEQRGRWDAARLGQALTNVVGNAVQHGADGTTVTVELRGTPEAASVVVHNRGAVIPAARLDGLFNPLRTRQAPRTASGRGPSGSLGLGLYIADRIVAAHGGRIEVESSESAGTRFTLHLPRRETPAARPDGAASASAMRPGGAGRRQVGGARE